MSIALREAGLVVGAIAAIVVVAAWSPVFGSGDDEGDPAARLDALTARVESIERKLGTLAGDSSKPSIAQRVATLEKALGELSRATGKPRWSSPESNLRELKRSLAAAERQRTGIGNRVSRLERDLRDATGCARELRNITTKLDDLRRSLRDLENRLRRLESRP